MDIRPMPREREFLLDVVLTKEDATARLKALESDFCHAILIDKNGNSYEWYEDEEESLFCRSAGNRLLLKLADECIEQSWEKYVTNMAVVRQANQMGMEPKFLVKTLLTGIIGAAEHYEYLTSEERSEDEPSDAVLKKQADIRELISSDNPKLTDYVNHLLHLQIEGAKELTDKLFNT